MPATLTRSPEGTDPRIPMPAEREWMDRREWLIALARWAPSAHNTQPWRFRVGPDRIDVLADLGRWCPVADPGQRELHLSLGCALETLLIGAERIGLEHRVELFPRPGRPELVATVRLRADGMPSPHRPAFLFDQVEVRRTHHGLYDGRPVGEDALAALETCVVEEGVRLWFARDAESREAITPLVERADLVAFADPRFREELADLIGRGAFGTPPAVRGLARLAVRHIDVGERTARRNARRMRSAGALGMVVTLTDDPATQVVAGQVIQRVWLMASHLGLAVQPMSGPLQVAKLRRRLANATGVFPACPQHLFRLGYAPQVRHRAPRRPLRELYAE